MAVIDIVTPTLNSERYLPYTLESLSRLQECCLADHAVVDSYSTDSTVRVSRDYGSRVLMVPPGNMYSAVNLGLESGSSAWCAYVNSDDLVYADAYSKALHLFGCTADVIYGDACYIDSMGRYLFYRRSPKPAYLRLLLNSGIMPFPQPTMIFRRDVFEALGGFREKYSYCSDFDFVLRAYNAGFRFHYYRNGPLAAFRLHSEQLSSRKLVSMRSEIKDCLESESLQGISRLHSSFLAPALIRLVNIDSYLTKAAVLSCARRRRHHQDLPKQFKI